MEFLIDLLIDLLGPAEPFKDPDRGFGDVFLFVLLLLVAVGAGAIYFLCRPA